MFKRYNKVKIESKKNGYGSLKQYSSIYDEDDDDDDDSDTVATKITTLNQYHSPRVRRNISTTTFINNSSSSSSSGSSSISSGRRRSGNNNNNNNINNSNYINKSNHNSKRKIWSTQEDKKLRVLVELNGTDWKFIVTQMKDRSTYECAYRWHNVLKVESSTLVEVITLDDDINYSLVPHKREDEDDEYTDEESSGQLKIKLESINYSGNGKSEQDHDNDSASECASGTEESKNNSRKYWTKDEEERLLYLIKENGINWSVVSLQMKRTPVQCSAKYHKLKKTPMYKSIVKQIPTKSKSTVKSKPTITKSNVKSNQPPTLIRSNQSHIILRPSTNKSLINNLSPIKSTQKSKKKNNNNNNNNNNIASLSSWTLEQDKELIRLIELFGTDDFDYISSKFKNKDSKKCSDRWNNHLKSQYLNQISNNNSNINNNDTLYNNNNNHNNHNSSNNDNYNNNNDNDNNDSDNEMTFYRKRWSTEEDNTLLKELEQWYKNGSLGNKWDYVSSKIKGRNAASCHKRHSRIILSTINHKS